jgi:hypothetical protein
MAGLSLKKLQSFYQLYLALPLGKHLIPIPYWSNKLKNGKILVEGAFGGKGTPSQIKKAAQKSARQEKLDLNKLTQKELIFLLKRNKIGLDCSGLVYQLLDFIAQQKKKKKLDRVLLGSQKKKGIRRVGVKEFCHPQNSFPIPLDQVQTGDFIVLDQKRHILLVLDKKANKINYIHSSQKTKKNGVHLGTLTITKPDRGLKDQKWSDQLKNGLPYNQIIHSKDGSYRLKIFI